MSQPTTDTPSRTNGHVGRPPERRRSIWRTLFYGASATIIGWAAIAVPLPFIEHVPGHPTAIAPLVEIEGADTTELDGSTFLLTVVLRQQTTLPAVAAWLDGDRRLAHISQVFPPDLDRDEHLERERERFGRQFEIAAAVGAQAAGVDAELVTEAVVVDILPGSSADGRLEPGDAILAVDGAPIVAAEELQARARAGEVGDVLHLTIRRNDEEQVVVVTLGESGEVEWPVIGILIETALDELQLPFDIVLAEGTRIGGPSAGMMVAITVYDLLADEDLLRGRTVMGTGTMDADGRVGTVGGVPEKLRAAAAYDPAPDLVLIPEPQLDAALETAPEGLHVVGVRTIDEALEILREDDH